MKKTAFVILSIFVAFYLRTGAAAGEYFDDMDRLGNNIYYQYHGFELEYLPNAIGLGMPDPSFFVFSNTASPYGWAQYRVNNATSVVVAVYSHAGTFASRDPTEPGRYTLGVYENMNISADRQQALYCAATNAVYTYLDGLKQVYHDGANYYFGPVTAFPAGELVGYGPNVSYSMDGVNFTRVQLNHKNLVYDFKQQFCYEEYMAHIPVTAKYLRVELNDITGVTLSNGSYLIKGKKLFTTLASVEIFGDQLTLGEPEPVASEPHDPPSSSSKKSNRDYDDEDEEEASPSEKEPASIKEEKLDLPLNSATVELKEPEKSSSAKSSSARSSKFEGTIRSSGGAAKSSSAKESKSAPQEETLEEDGFSGEPGPAELLMEEQAERVETVVYEIHRGENENETTYNKGIVSYMIAASGAIALLVVFQKK